MRKTKILIVDDDVDILEFLSFNFTKENYDVETATDGILGIKKTKEFKPEIILLDIMMPKMGGIDTCREIRKIPDFSKTFIIFLTAKDDEEIQISAYDNGANDFVSKPIRIRVLISRINAIRKKLNYNQQKGELAFDNLIINTLDYSVQIDSKKLKLPRKEFQLLYFLACHPNQVYQRDFLLSELWGKEVKIGDRTVDVHIKKIRDKIGDNFVKTIPGIGYKFEKIV